MRHAVQTQESTSPESRLRVLVVDDDADDRDLISALLSEVPVIGEVEAVSSFAEGREVIFAARHDVYLVDHRLGTHSGLDLVAEAVNRASGPCIVLTGYASPDADQLALDVGAHDFLDKSDLTARVLSRSIRYAVFRWRAESAARRQAAHQAALARLSRLALDGSDVDVFLAAVLAELTEATRADYGVIGQLEADGALTIRVALGVASESAEALTVPIIATDGTPWGVLALQLAETQTKTDDLSLQYVANLIVTVVDRARAAAAEAVAADRIATQASLLDQVYSGVVATDMDGRVIYWNRSAETLFGWSREEAVGTPLRDLAVVEVPDGDPMHGATAALSEHGVWEGQTVLRRRDGSTFPGRVLQSRLFDSRGVPAGSIGVCLDLTEKTALESEARRQGVLASTVLRSVNVPVALIEPDGGIATVNRAWAESALANRGDLARGDVGVNYLDLCRDAADEPAAILAHQGILSVLGGQPGCVLEYAGSGPGDPRWFQMEVTAIDEGGAVVVHRDVSTQRLRTIVLEETLEAKDQFIAALSHELRTPLTAVVGLAEELRTGEWSSEEISEIHGMIADQAQELSLLIEDLLVAARIESQTITYRNAEVLVAGELDHVLAPWTYAPVEVEVLDQPEPAAWADPGRVRQILRNLVSNAVRYGAAPITVSIRRDGPEVVVSVADHGRGVPEAVLSHLFEPYAGHRGDDSLPASVGLGLNVSRSLSEGLGGSLAYRREGDVTIFELRLPAHTGG